MYRNYNEGKANVCMGQVAHTYCNFAKLDKRLDHLTGHCGGKVLVIDYCRIIHTQEFL